MAESVEIFLKDMQEYTPPIPENVVKHLLAEGGMNTTDSRVAMTVNVAMQKYISDLLSKCSDVVDARIKNQNRGQPVEKDLQVSDLKEAVHQLKKTRRYNEVYIDRPEFLVSLPEENPN